MIMNGLEIQNEIRLKIKISESTKLIRNNIMLLMGRSISVADHRHIYDYVVQFLLDKRIKYYQSCSSSKVAILCLKLSNVTTTLNTNFNVKQLLINSFHNKLNIYFIHIYILQK